MTPKLAYMTSKLSLLNDDFRQKILMSLGLNYMSLWLKFFKHVSMATFGQKFRRDELTNDATIKPIETVLQ